METNSIEKKLKELGLELPVITPSKGIYHSCLVDGNKVYVSGHVSMKTDGSFITGKVGKDVSDDEAKIAARQCGLAMLSSVKKHFGTLDKIKRVIKLLGMVNAIPEYEKHALIINGCSELFRELWGEQNGVGARSAVGMGSLPANVSVEVEGIFEIHT